MVDASVEYLHLDVYKRSDPLTRYDTLPRYLELECTDELLGPGGGSFKIHTDDAKLAADQGNLFKHKNIFKVRRGEETVGAFLLQTRDLTSVDSNEVGSRVWQVSGEGLRGWFRDATVQPENGTLKQHTPDNRAFNFAAINKSRWYANSTWAKPQNMALWHAPGSPYSVKPGEWPTLAFPKAYWVWAPTSTATTDKELALIQTAVTDYTAMSTQFDATTKDIAKTKPVAKDIQADFAKLVTLLNKLAVAAQAASKSVTGSAKAAWSNVYNAASDAAAASQAAARTGSQKQDWTSAVKFTDKVQTYYTDTTSAMVNGIDVPAGDCYFRCEFTAPADGTYTFYLAANNTIDAYIDGQLVLSMPDSAETYDATQSVQQPLDAGNHVFAVKVTNTGKSIAGLIAGIAKEGTPAVGDAAAVDAVPISVTGDAKWTVCAYPAVPPGWTPGEIMLQLLSEASSRGVKFPSWLKPTFNEDYDSAGEPWARSGEFAFDVGTEYFDVLSALEAAGGDVYVDPASYQFHVYAKRGTNRSGFNLTNFTQDTSQLNPVVLRIGKNLLQAENTVTGQIKNSLVVKTADGYMVAKGAVDPELGVIEGSYQSNQKGSQSADIANLALQKFSTPDTSSTYNLVALSDLVPKRHFDAGDWVQAPGDDFVMTARRVMSVSCTADQSTGVASYALEFDTIQQDRLTVLERRLDALMNTGTTIGSSLISTTSVNLPSTVSSGIPGGITPSINAPTGLIGETDSYFTADGTAMASVTLSWNPVLSSVDGSIAPNVAYYEIWGAPTGQTMGSIARTVNTKYTVMSLPIDVSYTFRVRARQSDQNFDSAFSNDFVITTAVPTTELDRPSAPLVSSRMGVFTVAWDGNLIADDGSAHAAEARLRSVRLQIGLNPDLSDGQYFGQPLSATGSTSIADLTDGATYYFRFFAFDSVNLVSRPSDIVKAVLQGIELVDLPAAVGTIVQNGATILYQAATPGVAYQTAGTTWYDIAHGYKPYRWDGAQWAPITYGLQDDGSGTAIYSFIQTGAIAANVVTALQIQAKAVTTEKMQFGSITGDVISLGHYIPSGFATNVVPGPLLDSANWIKTWNAVTAGNLNPENVFYDADGVHIHSDATTRGLWSATPIRNVPGSRQVLVDWEATTDGASLWVRQITATNGGAGWTWWQDSGGDYIRKAFGHQMLTFDSSVLQYAVYFVVDPGQGDVIMKNVTVNEMTGSGYLGLENIQISKSSISMYNQAGMEVLSIAPSNKNFFAFENITDDGTSRTISLTQDGEGHFDRVTARDVFATEMSGIDTWTGFYGAGSDAANFWNGGKAGLVVNGTDVMGSIDDDDSGGGSYFDYKGTPYLNRFARNVIYRGYWDLPDGSSHYHVVGQYQRFAVGSFVLTPYRQYQIIVNNGGLQIGSPDNAAMQNNLYFDLMLSLGGWPGVINTTASGAVRAMRDVVYKGESGSWSHPPITVAAIPGVALTADELTRGRIPADTRIYWEYGSSQFNQPTLPVTLSSFGSGQSLTVIDQGPAFTNFFDPTYAGSTRYTGYYANGSSGGGDNATAGADPSGGLKRFKKTITMTAAWSRSWTKNGASILNGGGKLDNGGMLYQGVNNSPMFSMVGFNPLPLPAGSNVVNVQLYLKNRFTHSKKGVNAIIGAHDQGGPPNTFVGTNQNAFSWKEGEGKWVNLPTAWNTAWQGGQFRGISLGPSNSSGDFAYFDGAGKGAPPKLRVTFTYSAPSK